MPNVIVKEEATFDGLIGLPELKRLVLKSIFDFKHMSKSEWHLMEWTFEQYLNLLNGMIIESAVGDEMRIQLELMALQLRMDQEGKYDKRREEFKAHGIDYKKFYRLELPTKEEILKAQANLEEWNKKNGFPSSN